MKNKLVYVLLGLLVVFSFVNDVFAEDEFAIEIKATPSSSEITKGKEVVVSLNLSANRTVDHCQFKVEADESLSFKEKRNANGWNFISEAADDFTIKNSNPDASINNINIALITYVVNGDGKVTIHNEGCFGKTSEGEDYEATHEDLIVEITALDPVDDTTLKTLKVTSGGVMQQEFSSTNYGDYIINLDSSVFGLELEASNPDYQDNIVVKTDDKIISDYTKITFNDESGQGMMPIDIIVNEKTEYSLLALYEETELDYSLKTLKVNGQIVNLVNGKFSYEVVVDNNVTSFDVIAELNDSTNFGFDMEKGNAPGNFNINDRVDVEIVIIPKSENVNTDISNVTYRISVIKEKVNEENPDNKEPVAPSDKGDNVDKDGNVTQNQNTGGISMYIIGLILFASLVGSIVLYKKNLEGYK